MPSINRSFTLRTKLMLLAVLSIAAALTISCIAIFTYNEKAGFSKFKNNLQVIAHVLADRSVAALDFDDRALAQKNLSAVEANRSILLACIYDAQHKHFATYQPAQKTFSCPEFPERNRSIHNDTIAVEYPIGYSGEQLGTVFIVASLEQIRHQTLKSFYFSLTAAALAFTIAFIAAMYSQRFILRPIQQLRETMAKVQKNNDFSLRAKKTSKDELGDLVDAFNRMLNKIEVDTDAIKASEVKFRTLSSASPVGIFQTDAAGKIIYANNQWSKIVGISHDDDQDRWISAIHPKDREKIIASWELTINTGSDFRKEFRFSEQRGDNVSVICEAKRLFHLGKTTGFVGSILDISDLKQAQSQLEYVALHDPLTNIANRFHLTKCLDREIEKSRTSQNKISVFFLDIDDFKRINDSLGHDVGDELLIIVANRIQSCIRPTDIVARLGGDEFIVLVTDISDQKITDRIANDILSAIRRPIKINRHDINISVSIGITLGAEDNADSNALMKNADLAMFQAKSQGKDNFQYFSHELNQKILRRISLEREIRVALDEHELFLVYQPKYDIKRGFFTSFEALLRWESKSRGFISPAEVIPVAEDTGLIVPIGEWAIKTACADIKTMLTTGILPPDGRIAINLSLKQFRDQNLIEKVIGIIRAADVNPHNIEFEITETTLLEDVESTLKRLNTLKRLGITITIDDFGTGYSSLSYLKQLPIDYLKVDRSFIRGVPEDTNDSEITAAIIAMSHKLGLSVVAEGVETNEHLTFIKDNHCDVAQGFLFGKGITIAEIIDDFKNRPHYYNALPTINKKAN